MVEDTQRLTRDIEVTREDLTRDLDALTDRVSPARVVERRVQRTKNGAGRLKDRVMGSASSVMGSASSVKDTAGGAAGSATSTVGDAAHGVAGTASSVASGTKESIVSHTEGNPMAAAVIAFGIGWLVSSLMPVSEKEQQAAAALVDTAKEHGQPIADQAKQVAQEVGATLGDKAQDAAQSVKETAQVSAAHVSDQAKSSAQTVADDARTSG